MIFARKIRPVLLAAVVFSLLAAAPARAQLLKQQKPKRTEARYISMLYDKLTGHVPDFVALAQQTEEYKNATPVKRVDIQRRLSEQFQKTFSLITISEPIMLDVDAQISSYSPMGHGFLVQNFNDMTFFDYGYNGVRYALVPHGLVDYQWLKDFPEDEKTIMRETQNGHHAQMVFTMVPLAADPTPMQMNGQDYHLIMADISKIEMWSQDGKSVIWDSTMNDPSSTQSRIMNLYNH